LPLEITLVIALELAKPQMSDGISLDLHTFRLVCKAFSLIGKKAWTILARDHKWSGYTTLCLPPRKNTLVDLAQIFLADEGGLGKLVTNIKLAVMPSTHAEVTNPGVGDARWSSERPQIFAHDGENDLAQKRAVAVEQLMSRLQMSSNQIDFLQHAVTPSNQADIGLVLDQLPNAVSLNICAPSKIDWSVRSVFGVQRRLDWLDDYDFAGCCQLMNSVSSRCGFKNVILDLGYDLWLDRTQDNVRGTPHLPLLLYVTKVTYMHICFSRTFAERDAVGAALSSAQQLTDLSLYMSMCSYYEQRRLDILSRIPLLPRLQKLSLSNLMLTPGRRSFADSTLAQLLSAHRGTLNDVELDGFTEHESTILDMVQFMRSNLKLEDCGLAFEAEDPSVELRDLIRSLGGPSAIDATFRIVDNNFTLLSRYILGLENERD